MVLDLGCLPTVRQIHYNTVSLMTIILIHTYLPGYAAYNPNQFKFELMLLAEYEESFSTYTFKQFLEDYMMTQSCVQDEHQRIVIEKLQSNFSVTSVKVLLVSLLNAFRDLTLMGVQVSNLCCGPELIW